MSSPLIQVRQAQASDAEVITAFNLALAMESESLSLEPTVVRRGVEQVLGDPLKGHYRVATLEASVVGQLMVTKEWSDWRCGWWWWIQSVWVTPVARKQGVFRALYRSLMDEVGGSTDVRGVRLYVEQHNLAAHRTYESVGMALGKYVLYETARE